MAKVKPVASREPKASPRQRTQMSELAKLMNHREVKPTTKPKK